MGDHGQIANPEDVVLDLAFLQAAFDWLALKRTAQLDRPPEIPSFSWQEPFMNLQAT
jgi:hypothetical protein